MKYLITKIDEKTAYRKGKFGQRVLVEEIEEIKQLVITEQERIIKEIQDKSTTYVPYGGSPWDEPKDLPKKISPDVAISIVKGEANEQQTKT